MPWAGHSSRLAVPTAFLPKCFFFQESQVPLNHQEKHLPRSLRWTSCAVKKQKGWTIVSSAFFQGKEKVSEHLPCDAPQLGATRCSSATHTGQQQTLPVSHTTTLPARTSPLPALQRPKMEGGVLPSGPAALALPPQAHLRLGPPNAARWQHSPLRHRASRGSFPWVSSWRRSTTQMGISTWKNSHRHYPTVPTASCHNCMAALQGCREPLPGWEQPLPGHSCTTVPQLPTSRVGWDPLLSNPTPPVP